MAQIQAGKGYGVEVKSIFVLSVTFHFKLPMHLVYMFLEIFEQFKKLYLDEILTFIIF